VIPGANFFVVNYDYGTGSAYVGIFADSKDQIESLLKFVTVVDPAALRLDEKLLRLLRDEAKPIDDSSWDDIRR
jgi:hypothetical protein